MARIVAAMTESHHLPVAPYDCREPVVFCAPGHLSVNLPNALVQESVRACYTGWYKELVTRLPTVKDGHVYPPDGPGLVTELLRGLPERTYTHPISS